MLAELMAWWLAQIRGLVQGTAGRNRFTRATIVRPDGGALAATARRQGRETPLGWLEPDSPALRRLRGRNPGPLVLSLPGTDLLQQSASLPLAAERDLATILEHEMDRLTPFRAEDVFWAWRIERRDAQAGRLRLRLLLAAKSRVAQSLAALAALGLRPSVLEFGSEHLPLAPPGAATPGRRQAKWAGAACLTLAAALCAAPVVRQEWRVSRAERQIARLQPQVDRAEAARRRIAGAAGSASVLTAETARIASALRVLAALTDALPDDTYLSSLALHDHAVSLTGRSEAAAKLIGRLSASPDLRNPAFDAPVTRVSANADVFSIRVTAAP